MFAGRLYEGHPALVSELRTGPQASREQPFAPGWRASLAPRARAGACAGAALREKPRPGLDDPEIRGVAEHAGNSVEVAAPGFGAAPRAVTSAFPPLAQESLTRLWLSVACPARHLRTGVSAGVGSAQARCGIWGISLRALNARLAHPLLVLALILRSVASLCALCSWTTAAIDALLVDRVAVKPLC